MNAKEFLEQYTALNAEIEQIERELGKLASAPTHFAADCVLGSPAHEPYQNMPMPMSGYVQSEKTQEAKRNLVKVYDQKLSVLYKYRDAAECALSRISDAKARTIIRYRYLDGLTWLQIADKLGGNNTEESVKKYSQRAIEKIS